ncbi:RICIN domain-containing protein [Chondromyces apiculatus]|uniref:Endo-1,4-beta-xylanase A n=1 Tax=Chondromyces apiculatus DSM 436 TaxID=1192034 RepID=A0A017TFE8_9BACT|nr:RICIN domain-containing protein [Chondromyces apiculatus]EYF07632.1 Endo-1,4-beta-xylanase A precursor [Chondromyces apiculatus DSM 436]
MIREIAWGGVWLGGLSLLLTGCVVADETAIEEESEDESVAVIVSNVTEGDYVIRSVATGKCLDIASSNTANGGRVQSWTCNGTNAQKFHVSPTGDGFFKIVNVNSNKALDVKEVSTAANAEVQQWEYGGGANQQWRFVNRGGVEMSIQVRHTDMALDLYWGNAADGTAILQYPYQGTSNQRWTLDKISGGGGGGSNPPANGKRQLSIRNQCGHPIWIAHSNNVQAEQNKRLNTGESFVYDVPDGGINATRFWPKTGCNASGLNCTIGDSVAPCPSGGCQPPIESKFEATFAPKGGAEQTWYNLSQVDGYTLPFKVVPQGQGAEAGSCVTSDCSGLSLAQCPSGEYIQGYGDQDLRVRDGSGNVIGCMAPCKKWNYPAPWGLGRPEHQDPGLHLCCPTPIDPATGQCTVQNACMSPNACSNAGDPQSVVHTDYVKAMQQMCPSAYSYAYDDAAGLHACPSTTSFEVTFCP